VSARLPSALRSAARSAIEWVREQIGAGILSDTAIRRAVARGDIVLDPYRPEQVNQASYDLRLGRGVRVYKDTTHDWAHPSPCPGGTSFTPSGCGALDVRLQNQTRSLEMEPGRPFLLQPGIGYLLHTEESVYSERYVGCVDGKSSLGRLFASSHVTAGYIDPGYRGQITLEVVVTHPLWVVPGMRFAQIRWHTIVGQATSYQKAGHYTGVAARGAASSQSWKQFQEAKK